MSIKPVESLSTGLKIVGSIAPTQKTAGDGFGTALTKALAEVSASQKLSGDLTKAFTLEDSTVSLEQVMVAGVKSNIGFQATLQTRNRLVQAYTDIMNMPI